MLNTLPRLLDVENWLAGMHDDTTAVSIDEVTVTVVR